MVLNGSIYTLCKIIGVAASKIEAELVNLFSNTQETVQLRTVLQELGHTQPPTPSHTDNTTATVIIHKIVIFGQ